MVAKITLQEFPTMSLAFLRFSLASLFLAPFFWAQTKKVKIKRTDLPKLITIGILIITLNITFFFEGIKRTSAIDASILTMTIPILSVMLGWWFLKEKVYLINLFGIILSLIGAVIILGLPQMLVGNTLIILASVCWVIGAIISKKILTKYSSLVVTAIAFLIGVITFAIPAASEYFQNPAWPSQVTTLGILGLIYMTLLSSISAYFLFEWGLSKTNVTTADLFQYIEPLIAILLGIAILGEQLTVSFLIGGALVAIGAFLGTLAKEVHHRHKHHRM